MMVLPVAISTPVGRNLLSKYLHKRWTHSCAQVVQSTTAGLQAFSVQMVGAVSPQMLEEGVSG